MTVDFGTERTSDWSEKMLVEIESIRSREAWKMVHAHSSDGYMVAAAKAEVAEEILAIATSWVRSK